MQLWNKYVPGPCDSDVATECNVPIVMKHYDLILFRNIPDSCDSDDASDCGVATVIRYLDI